MEKLLKCGTKIEWRDPCSWSLKKGLIIEERLISSSDGFMINSYMVSELDTGLIYEIENKDITLVNLDGEWVGFIKLSSGCPRRSGRYPLAVKAPNVINYRYIPKQVIFNGPATIVLWKDGTKTIVKRREGEEDDHEKAIMYCILKKLCGNKATMDKYLKLFLKEESNDEEKKD